MSSFWQRAVLCVITLLVSGAAVARAEPVGAEPQPASAPSEGGLVLLGAPPGAALIVDGQQRAVTPLRGPLHLAAGPHAVLVKRTGFRTFEGRIEISAERVAALEVEMPRTAGVLIVTAKPASAPARVYVDGTPRGEAPLEIEVGQGPHQVRVHRDGYYEDVFQFEAVLGEETRHDAQLSELPPNVNPYRPLREKKPWYTRWWVWTLAGVGASGIAAAIVVPTVLSSRSDCQRLAAEVCFPVQIPSVAPVQSPQALAAGLTLVF